jgi:hypothetical protein
MEVSYEACTQPSYLILHCTSVVRKPYHDRIYDGSLVEKSSAVGLWNLVVVFSR